MTTSRLPYLVVAFGVFLLCIMDVLIKAAALRHPTAQVVAMRFACGLPWALALMAFLKPAPPTTAMLKAHALRGALVVVTAFLFFYALAVLELAEAIALSFLAPLFLSLFAAAILKERISLKVAGAVVVGFIGMGLMLGAKVSGGAFTDARLLGALAAIGCAVTYALNLVLLRQRAQSDPLALIIVFQNAFPLLFITPFAAAVWQTPDAQSWAQFVLIGAIGIAGHSCLAWAFARAPAGPLGVIEYTALVWGSLFGFLFFTEVPAWTTWVGAGLIVAACLAAARHKG